MKIVVQHIWPETVPFIADCHLLWSGQAELFRRVARSDTVVEQSFVPKSPYNTMYSFLELLNDAELVKGIIRAERNGFDAGVIGCGNDPGLKEAREATSFPRRRRHRGGHAPRLHARVEIRGDCGRQALHPAGGAQHPPVRILFLTAARSVR